MSRRPGQTYARNGQRNQIQHHCIKGNFQMKNTTVAVMYTTHGPEESSQVKGSQ
ncbi:Uncharacterized protein DAT39_021119, partial [Clarias magur]